MHSNQIFQASKTLEWWRSRAWQQLMHYEKSETDEISDCIVIFTKKQATLLPLFLREDQHAVHWLILPRPGDLWFRASPQQRLGRQGSENINKSKGGIEVPWTCHQHLMDTFLALEWAHRAAGSQSECCQIASSPAIPTPRNGWRWSAGALLDRAPRPTTKAGQGRLHLQACCRLPVIGWSQSDDRYRKIVVRWS